MDKTAQTIFNVLAGGWMIERTISGAGLFKGHAVFTETGDTALLCEESGDLFLDNGYVGKAERSYEYKLQDNRLLILYHDSHRAGDIMHELDFSDGTTARHVHLCGQDSYDLTFRFNSDVSIKTEWVIKGPQKDQRIETVLSRIP